MTDIIVDGKTRVFAVPLAALNLSALTVANIGTGEALHDELVPTGLEGFEAATAEVDNTALSSTFDTKLPGRQSFSGTGLVLKKQAVASAAFTLISVKDTDLAIVIMDGEDADTVATIGDEYEAYQVRTADWNHVGRGEANSLLRYRVPVSVSGARVRGVLT